MPQELFLEFSNNTLLPFLFGEHNTHLSHLEKKLNVSIADRGNTLRVAGEEPAVRQVENILNALYRKLEKKDMTDISIADIDAQLRFMDSDKSTDAPSGGDERRSALAIRTKKKTIAPRTPNQATYIEMIRQKDMVFGLGPAGTGKTYLAVAAGVDMFLQGRVERLVFCRPAVEAGENLGFLPGDMKEKIDPYLRPVYDALHDMLPFDFLVKRMETGDIEIAPLAFMRGRTLAHAFVILDEAQNATTMQMKMFLTRMGEASRMVITGDPKQSDLPGHVKSGLNEAIEILSGIDEIGFTRFETKDVVRHPLVGKILKAYDGE
ncbi:MAG: PhoH family protein [Alphaproteobacteria bacterium]|nr:PhoH family protein [Alphaproteobacteria bacterium]